MASLAFISCSFGTSSGVKDDPKPVSGGYCVIKTFDQGHIQRSSLFDGKI